MASSLFAIFAGPLLFILLCSSSELSAIESAEERNETAGIPIIDYFGWIAGDKNNSVRVDGEATTSEPVGPPTIHNVEEFEEPDPSKRSKRHGEDFHLSGHGFGGNGASRSDSFLEDIPFFDVHLDRALAKPEDESTRLAQAPGFNMNITQRFRSDDFGVEGFNEDDATMAIGSPILNRMDANGNIMAQRRRSGRRFRRSPIHDQLPLAWQQSSDLRADFGNGDGIFDQWVVDRTVSAPPHQQQHHHFHGEPDSGFGLSHPPPPRSPPPPHQFHHHHTTQQNQQRPPWQRQPLSPPSRQQLRLPQQFQSEERLPPQQFQQQTDEQLFNAEPFTFEKHEQQVLRAQQQLQQQSQLRQDGGQFFFTPFRPQPQQPPPPPQQFQPQQPQQQQQFQPQQPQQQQQFQAQPQFQPPPPPPLQQQTLPQPSFQQPFQPQQPQPEPLFQQQQPNGQLPPQPSVSMPRPPPPVQSQQQQQQTPMTLVPPRFTLPTSPTPPTKSMIPFPHDLDPAQNPLLPPTAVAEQEQLEQEIGGKELDFISSGAGHYRAEFCEKDNKDDTSAPTEPEDKTPKVEKKPLEKQPKFAKRINRF